MSWPSWWGPNYWFWKHASAQARIGLVFTIEQQESLRKFMVSWCKLLPCGGCKLNCFLETSKAPPTCVNGQEFWAFTVGFHNTVNERLKKPHYSLLEAQQAFEIQLRDYGGKAAGDFLSVYWFPLIYAAHLVTIKDKPTPEEQAILQEYYTLCVEWAPFSVRDEVKQKLIACFPLDLSSKDAIFTSLVVLHNSVCTDFNVLPVNVTELKAPFLKYFSLTDNYAELVRAQKVLQESNEKMVEMQKIFQLSTDVAKVKELQDSLQALRSRSAPCP